MVDEGVRIELDPDGKFKAYLDTVKDKLSDLRTPFGVIAKSWFQSNQAIFNLKGPGKWAPLSDSYLKFKRSLGYSYNIFQLNGTLQNSLTMPGDENAVVEITKDDMILGTKATSDKGAPYPIYLQQGFRTRKGKGSFVSKLNAISAVPARPFVMIGAEQTGPDEFNNREAAWIEIMKSYADQVLGGGAA